jgi:anti-sigma factor RsiW
LNCKSVIREISDYIDAALEPEVKKELEQHMKHCKDCKMVVDQTKRTVDVFCDSEPIELPIDVKTRLHEALRRKISEKRQ